VKGFLSGARKMVRPREDESFFLGSSSSGVRRSQLMSHIELQLELEEMTSVRGTT
jgi:hypothetical protein